jgi:hypothetical protein
VPDFGGSGGGCDLRPGSRKSVRKARSGRLWPLLFFIIEQIKNKTNKYKENLFVHIKFT